MKREVDLGGRKVTLVGTAHVSEESRKEVENTIAEVNPDFVGVELDQDRFESLRDRTGWKELDLSEAIKDGKGYLLFLNLVLAIYQRRLGMEQGVNPGEEMLAAVETAESKDIEYGLIDRELPETFSRLREELSLWEKMKLVSTFLADEEEIDIEELKESNVLDQLMSELEEEFPSITRVFLDERNAYMVEKLLEEDFEHAVVVVGAAHVEGMVEMLEEEKSEVYEPSKKIPWFTLFKYGFPVTIIVMLGYSFYSMGFATGMQGVQFWVIANGLMAMLGAILSRSHVLTWITSFISAPLTSLYPVVGAGMVASYVEGKFYPPTVEELEDIVYIESYRDLWGNQAGRILLTFVLVSLGSALATFVGAGYIASLISPF